MTCTPAAAASRSSPASSPSSYSPHAKGKFPSARNIRIGIPDDVTVRVAKKERPSARPGSVRSRSQLGIEQERQRRQRAHGPGDHLRCLRRRARPPSAVAVALAVVAGALKAEDPVRSPSR